MTGCKLFAGGVYETVTKGVLIDAGVNNITVTGTKVENCGGGVVDLTGSGGDHRLDIQAQYYDGFAAPSPAILGTIDNHSTVMVPVINSDGVSTSDSVFRWPQRIQSVNATFSNLTVNGAFYAPSIVNTLAFRALEFAFGWAIPATLTTYSGNLAHIIDLSYATEVRMTVSRIGDGPAGSVLGLVYWDNTLSDYAWLASNFYVSAGPSYNSRDTGWLPIAANAAFDGMVVLVAGMNGDGATQAYTGNICLMWR